MPNRGCGTRIAGGIYLVTIPCVPGDIGCRQIEHFLLDPPMPCDPEALGISAQGMMPYPGLEKDVVDWIGAANYPNVWDWVAEAKRWGISRRIPSTYPFSLLTATSKLWVVHPKGWIEEGGESRDALWNVAVREGMRCPKQKREHPSIYLGGTNPPSPMCVGLYKEVVEGGEPDEKRAVVRTIGDTTYIARSTPSGVDLEFFPAFFGLFQLSRIEVVRDLENGTHEAAAGKASRAGLEVSVVSE